MSETLSETLAKHIEAANVLVIAGKIEDTLERLLLVAGRPISNRIAKRLFAGMGALSSFSGKIEVAYLFDLIDESMLKDLLVIKDVRNAFAHTTQYVFFSQERIAAKCRNLSTFTAGVDPQHAFYDRALGLSVALDRVIDRFMLSKALRDKPTPIVDEED